MGNCQKRDQALTVTNFDDQKWAVSPTNIHSHCFMLKNYYHPNVRLLKWIASSNKKTKISNVRQQLKVDYIPSVYQSGETRKLCNDITDQQNGNNVQKRSYIVTEQLIRLKDLTLTFQQAAIISYQSLSAYKELMKQLGGFVARENMIYITREGVIKVWVNENLANNELQFPHPLITQKQFNSSLLHQIFTRVRTNGFDFSSAYEYLKSGQLTFNEVLSKLNLIISQNNLPSQLSISKETFNKIFNKYEEKDTLNKSFKSKSIRSKSKDNSNQKGLKFIVAEGQLQNNSSFVRDYSKKAISERERPNGRRYSDAGLSNAMITGDYINQQALNLYFRPQWLLINESFTA